MQDDRAAFASEESGRLTPPPFSQIAAVSAPAGAESAKLWDAMTILIEAMNCVLVDEDEHARQYVLSAFRLLSHDVAEPARPGRALTDNRQPCRGGLAGWQVRRISLHIDLHLGETVFCEELARIAKLSVSHFIRAFKVSFGCSPHTYLTQRRVERAQGLMLTTDAPLGQIALDCGLADQSHLSRIFKQSVGESPGAWRRARVQCSVETG